jgi:hypothetical protein
MLSRGLDPIQYDRATKCNGGTVPPGTKAMVAWLEHNASGVNWGEYRCEMWGKHEASIHSAGRAIDWHPSSMAAGRALVKLLLAPDKQGNTAALARRMGVQGLIFDCQSWFGGWDGQLGKYSYCYGKNGKRKKNLDPTQAHRDHVHIELNLRGAAKKTTFWNESIKYDTPIQQQLPTRQPQAPAPMQPQVPASTPVATPAPITTQPQAPTQPTYGSGGGTGWNGGGNWGHSGGQYGGGSDDDWG